MIRHRILLAGALAAGVAWPALATAAPSGPTGPTHATVDRPAIAGATTDLAAALPRPDHVVIVVMENKRYDSVIGHPKTPYLSSLARSRGANLTQFHATTYPSQPNYLAMFSGSTQGITDNSCPHDFQVRANLGRQLLDRGYSFVGYAEDLPSVGFRGCSRGKYVRRHNPWVNFRNVPAASNRPLTQFPSDYRRLPTVSFVIPNLCNDMHDCPKAVGDAWLKKRFDGYLRWAMTHNSLLIVTFDEDNKTGGNRIATIIAGQHVRPGQYAWRLDHYSLLRTLQDMYRLPPLNMAARRAPITGIFARA